MLLRNPLALENMNEFRAAHWPPEDAVSTVSENRTNPARRFTQKIQAVEERQLMRAQRIAQNTWNRNNARDFEAEYYRAVGVGTW